MAELGDTLLITVTATSSSYVKTLQARVIPGSDGTWKNAIVAGQELDMSKGKGIVNGNLHANSKAKVGSKYTVNGDIKTAPPTISMPTIDWDFYKNAAIAQGHYFTSEIKFTKDDSPVSGIWYSTKEIEIEDNNVIVNGSLISEEDIEIEKNNVEIYATPSNYPALVAKHDLHVDFNNTIIEGLIYAGHDIEFQKNNGDITGAIIVGNKIKQEGNNFNITLDSKYTSGLLGMAIDSTMLETDDMEIVTWIEK
jgi:hypothetical protein